MPEGGGNQLVMENMSEEYVGTYICTASLMNITTAVACRVTLGGKYIRTLVCLYMHCESWLAIYKRLFKPPQQFKMYAGMHVIIKADCNPQTINSPGNYLVSGEGEIAHFLIHSTLTHLQLYAHLTVIHNTYSTV